MNNRTFIATFRHATLVALLVMGLGVVQAQETPTPTAAVTNAPTFTATAYQTVAVRSGPSAQFDIVARLNAGDTVTVNGVYVEDDDWLNITLTDGTLGWAVTFLFTFDYDLAVLPRIDGAGDETSPDDNVVIRAYGRVNVRSGPGIDSTVIGQLPVTAQARATARSSENNDWLHIEYTDADGTMSGWVAFFTVDIEGDADMLPVRLPNDSGQLVAPESLLRALYNTRLRDDPSLDAEVVAVVPFGSYVTLLARTRDGAWFYVSYDDRRAWGAVELFEVTAEQIRSAPVFGEGFVEAGLTAVDLSESTEEPPAIDEVVPSRPLDGLITPTPTPTD